METVNKEIIVKEIVVPNSHVIIVVKNKEDFMDSIKEVTTNDEGKETTTYGGYFKKDNTLYALGDNILFMYEEEKE